MILAEQDPAPDRYQQFAAAVLALFGALVAYIAKLKSALSRELKNREFPEKRMRQIIREELAEEFRWRDYGQRLHRLERRNAEADLEE